MVKSGYKLLLSVLLCSVSLTSCSIKSGTDYLVSGNEYFKAGDYAKAERDYRQTIKLEPKSSVAYATALNNLGVVLNESGKYDDAVGFLSEATKTDPKNAVAHYVFAEALAHKARYDEAMAEAQKAIDLNPPEHSDKYRSYRALAAAALGKGEVDLAIEQYHNAIDIDPDNDAAHHNLSVALEKAENYDAAIAEERKALELNPDSDDAQIHLAVLLNATGKREEAVSELNKVLTRDRNQEEAKKYLHEFEQPASKASKAEPAAASKK